MFDLNESRLGRLSDLERKKIVEGRGSKAEGPFTKFLKVHLEDAQELLICETQGPGGEEYFLNRLVIYSGARP